MSQSQPEQTLSQISTNTSNMFLQKQQQINLLIFKYDENPNLNIKTSNYRKCCITKSAYLSQLSAFAQCGGISLIPKSALISILVSLFPSPIAATLFFSKSRAISLIKAFQFGASLAKITESHLAEKRKNLSSNSFSSIMNSIDKPFETSSSHPSG